MVGANRVAATAPIAYRTGVGNFLFPTRLNDFKRDMLQRKVKQGFIEKKNSSLPTGWEGYAFMLLEI